MSNCLATDIIEDLNVFTQKRRLTTLERDRQYYRGFPETGTVGD